MGKILVTGAAGFIGSNLCERLLKEGQTVIGVDNFVTGSEKNVERLKGVGGFEFFEMNVVDSGLIEKFSGEDLEAIYHLACPASPVDFGPMAVEILETSALGTMNVLRLAKAAQARVLFSSTSEIYGDPLEHPQSEDYFGNVNTLGPRSCYDEGKRFSESYIVHFCKREGVDFKIARIFNTYGPHMRENDGRVMPNFIKQMKAGEPLTIYGDGMQTRSFCYVDDMVEGLIKLMNFDGEERVFNLGNPHEISIVELAETLMELTGADMEIVFKELPKDDPKKRCPDISKAEKLLDFGPKISLKDGLKKTLEL